MKDTIDVAKIFGENVFNDKVMRDRLPKNVYKTLKKTINEGYELDPSIADSVAQAMKEWAIENGATHYTHWFQPLTGITAEKHDSFISAADSEGKVIMEFSGKELIKGESDASSFPSGGLRATFEARGYTVWDCTSPAFLRHEEGCTTLCIPTAFCSFTGATLDKKTPLLRSMQVLNNEALRLIRFCGNETSKTVKPYVGAEQEYFLIDRNKYLKRKDLIYTGRTLFGVMPAKGQELNDHYYGVIRKRISSFMADVDMELWKLGVTAKTEHNEVAPAQHELAPVYDEANLAVDHNHLVMEMLKKVASRHGLVCLLHEKPFSGVNGSGKHNNWSLITDDGINLLNPGETPHENIQFLVILACILAAVDTHADLLRFSAADVGNDHRLGTDEAPPAIISCFLGTQLEDVVEQLIGTGYATRSTKPGNLKTGVNTLPDLYTDVTDRNRTSPFAFTGNKFEFRMVGSSDSIAGSTTILNAIVAEQFRIVSDRLEKADNVKLEIHDIIKELLSKHKRIIFNGNGYSKQWEEEAKRRGLPNIKSMVDAIPVFTKDKAIKLFESFGIYTRAELKSRVEVEYEEYSKVINIEARAMANISGKQLIPAIIEYAKRLAGSINEIKATGLDLDIKTECDLLRKVSKELSILQSSRLKLLDDLEEISNIKDAGELAKAYHNIIISDMKSLRAAADRLEPITDKDLWPFPSYGDLLFEVSAE